MSGKQQAHEMAMGDHEAGERRRLESEASFAPWLYGAFGLWTFLGVIMGNFGVAATGALVTTGLAIGMHLERKGRLRKAAERDEAERLYQEGLRGKYGL